MAQTKTQIAEAIAQRDMAHGACRRLAEMVMGGCDYDEMAQRLTDTYAEWLGISEDDCEAYDLVNEVANEHLMAELRDTRAEIAEAIADKDGHQTIADVLISLVAKGYDRDEVAEMGWRHLIVSEEGYDGADEDMTEDDIREYAQDLLDEIGRGFFFGRITDEMVVWAYEE